MIFIDIRKFGLAFALIMFPILVFIYVRLAKREEKESFEQLGEVYALYAKQVPGFFPRPRKLHTDRSPCDAERSTS